MGKLYERIINNRITKEVEITEAQAGGQKGKATTDHLLILKDPINDAQNRRKTTYAAFLDVTKAYDKAQKRTHKHPLASRNKNTLETCKNPRPTSGWSELTKSCTTSTMNFHMAYFSWIPQNNARLKLSCKFGESKCNPITLTTSHGMDYVLNEHLDFKPTWSICNTISDNIMIQLIWKFQESNWKPDWFNT